jgi:glycogen synthase
VKVLQLGSIPPPHGGVQSNVSALRERLRERGDQCQVIAITRSSEIVPNENEFHPRSSSELLRLLLRLDYDILHLHLGGNFRLRLAALAAVCGRMPNCKTVLTFHSGGFASTREGQTANPFSMHGFGSRSFDRIVAVNAEIVGLFERYGVRSEKIAVVPASVLKQPNENVEIPAPLLNFIENHSPVLLSVGLLETHYDLPLQIQVLKMVRRDFPNAGLLMIGSGGEEASLRREIAATDYAEHIALPGDVDHEIVLHLIKRADVLLRTTVYDGDAISVREALFLGTPVVATDNQMRPDNIKLIEIGNLNQLHAAVVGTLREGKTPQTATGDGWQNIDAVLKIYDELLNLGANSEISSIRNPQSAIRN